MFARNTSDEGADQPSLPDRDGNRTRRAGMSVNSGVDYAVYLRPELLL
jgi:hypothetical protein